MPSVSGAIFQVGKLPGAEALLQPEPGLAFSSPRFAKVAAFLAHPLAADALCSWLQWGPGSGARRAVWRERETNR